MPGTALFDVAATPVAVTGVGEAGAFAVMLNAGDDPLSWHIAGTTPAAEGMPGFTLKRGATATITLPDPAIHRVWAWCPDRTRLAVTRGPGSGITPGATAAFTMDATPTALPRPAALPAHGTFTVANVGAQPVSWIAAPTGSPPDGSEVGGSIDPGATQIFSDWPDGDSTIYAWTRRFGGTSILLQHSDDHWRI